MEKCYRISSYLISIKLVGQDKYALLQGYTGAVDIVNKEIMLYLNGNRELLSMPESILNRMLDRGYITTKSQEEELLFVKRMANAFHERNKLLTKNFTLVVTYDCNFSCPYCFEKELQNEFSKRHIVISKQFVDKFFSKI